MQHPQDIHWTEDSHSLHDRSSKAIEEENVYDDDSEVDSTDSFFSLFADPDPNEVFQFDFPSANIQLQLNGQKRENGQLLNSTGLTLWKASEWLSRYLVENPELVHDKTVLELGSGLGLCGILSHKLGASNVVLTDGDIHVLSNLRDNISKNCLSRSLATSDSDENFEGEESINKRILPEKSKISSQQLIWGRIDQYQSLIETVDVLLGADIVYVPEILEPLWSTVSSILAGNKNGIFVLSFLSRNVPFTLVLEYATQHGFVWLGPFLSSDDQGKNLNGQKTTWSIDGVYIFSQPVE